MAASSGPFMPRRGPGIHRPVPGEEIDHALDTILDENAGLVVLVDRLLAALDRQSAKRTPDEDAIVTVLDAIASVMPPGPASGTWSQTPSRSSDLAALARRARALRAKYAVRVGTKLVSIVATAAKRVQQSASPRAPSPRRIAPPWERLGNIDTPEGRQRAFAWLVAAQLRSLDLNELRGRPHQHIEAMLASARPLRRILDEDDPPKLARAVLRALGASAKRADNVVSAAGRMQQTRARAKAKRARS